MSHDVLTASEISDMYNVPFDSDIYAVPVDVVRPEVRPPPGRPKRHHRKPRRRHASSGGGRHGKLSVGSSDSGGSKRHSVPGTSARHHPTEPIHMTLHEVRQYLQNLYSSSSDSSENKATPRYVNFYIGA